MLGTVVSIQTFSIPTNPHMVGITEFNIWRLIVVCIFLISSNDVHLAVHAVVLFVNGGKDCLTFLVVETTYDS